MSQDVNMPTRPLILCSILGYEYCAHSGTTLQPIFEYLSGIR
jgi:hypothetical protein